MWLYDVTKTFSSVAVSFLLSSQWKSWGMILFIKLYLQTTHTDCLPSCKVKYICVVFLNTLKWVILLGFSFRSYITCLWRIFRKQVLFIQKVALVATVTCGKHPMPPLSLNISNQVQPQCDILQWGLWLLCCHGSSAGHNCQ